MIYTKFYINYIINYKLLVNSIIQNITKKFIHT